MKRIVIAVLMLGVSAGTLRAQAPELDPPPHLDIRVRPIPDLVCFALQLTPTATPAGAEFAQVAEAVRPIQQAMRGSIGNFLPLMNALTIPALEAEHVRALQEVYAQLPESLRLGNGETFPLRAAAIPLAVALERAEPSFMSTIWPRHQALIDTASTKLTQSLLPREAECFDYIAGSLGLAELSGNVPVYLVAEAPRPGGFTGRGPVSGGCIVSVVANRGSLLDEIVLHEAIHYLDVEDAGAQNVLNQLRERLKKSGLTASDPDFRNVPHTLMFVQAAETIRRKVDPAHQHYGDRGYYARVPLAAQADRPNWIAFLDGKLTRAAAVEKIVADFLEARGGAGSKRP